MPANVVLEFGNGFESVYPFRFWLLQKGKDWVVSDRRLASEPHGFRQNAATRLSQYLFIATPR